MTGSKNVLIAEPVRLAAIAIPMPEARRSVGKSSGRYTYTRLDAADKIPANTANKAIIATGGMSLQAQSTNMADAAMQKLPIRKLRLGSRSITNNPAIAPPNNEAL